MFYFDWQLDLRLMTVTAVKSLSDEVWIVAAKVNATMTPCVTADY